MSLCDHLSWNVVDCMAHHLLRCFHLTRYDGDWYVSLIVGMNWKMLWTEAKTSYNKKVTNSSSPVLHLVICCTKVVYAIRSTLISSLQEEVKYT